MELPLQHSTSSTMAAAVLLTLWIAPLSSASKTDLAAVFTGQPLGRSPPLLQLAAQRTPTCAVLTDLTLSQDVHHCGGMGNPQLLFHETSPS